MIAPLLWEIRRERTVELIGEGFRLEDLRRWLRNVAANANIPILNGAAEGYIVYEGVPPTPYPVHDYLNPIPSNQIVLNPNITQNDGWK